MKKAVIKVSLNAEKLRAVENYMEKKEVNLEEELVDQVQKLYQRYVPVNVREYIDEKQEEEKKKRKPKKSPKKQAETNNPSTIEG